MALKPAYLQWGDDGILRSADYGDIYFQPQKGPEESHYVFLEKNRLPERFAAATNGMRIAELGFGTGLNFLLTARLWRQSGAPGTLFYASIEKHPLARADLARVFSFWPELGEFSAPLLDQYPPALEGFYHLRFKDVHLMLCLGDVAEVLPEVEGAFDAWYLDGFAPAKNPAMWEEKLFPLIAARTAPGGTLATFSSAGAVRQGLAAAGFAVEKTQGYGVKRDMTVAQWPGESAGAARRPVTVLGAGLGGASVAYALAEKGCAVTVIDRQPAAGAETSGNPVGILYPKLTADRSPFGLFFQHGFFFTRNLVTALRLPSWQPCGVMNLDTGAEEAQRHQAMAGSGFWPDEFMQYDGQAQHLPFGGAFSPPDLCRRLLDHPRITTRFGEEVKALAGGTVVVSLAGNTKSFPQLSWLPLGSLRGQITFLRVTPASAALRQVLCYNGTLTPAVGGVHYAGATFQREAPVTPAVRAEDDAENLRNIQARLPQFGFTEKDIVGARAGYRTTVPDHLPLIGRVPDQAACIEHYRAGRMEGAFFDDIYIATGFGGQGLSAAPLAGEILACQMLGLPLPVPQSLMAYLAPERFILRDIKRGKL